MYKVYKHGVQYYLIVVISKQNKWIVPVNGEGDYRSVYNSTLCLYTKIIDKGTILADVYGYKIIYTRY